ncbi:MAG: site-specific integrase [Firmicutes bacterium]|nr:site-specific integrase [Bacillota bacterium]
MASINKIDKNKYQIVVSYTGKDGKRKFKKKQFIGTLKEARQESLLFEEEIKVSDYADGHLIKFKDFLEIYITKYGNSNLKPWTLIEYTKALNKKAVPVIGNMFMSDIKPLDIQKIYDIEKAKGNKTGTIKRIHIVLNGVFKYAYKMCYIEENPCDRIILPKNDSKFKDKLHYFDIPQTKIFLSLAEQERIQFNIYFKLAIFGGFRRGELIALTWNDINFKNKQISINKSAKDTAEGQIIKETKTKGSNRTIVLPDECFELLQEWRKENKTDYVFIQHNGERMNLSTPYNKMKEMISTYNQTAEVKLPLIRLHDLRHTSATLLLANKVDIETVANRLGHSQVSTTLDIYGHALKEMDIKASNVLTNIFK